MLTVRVQDALDDEIAAVLGTDSLGVEVVAAGPGFSELRVYLASIDEAHAWRERALHVLSAHGLSGGDAMLAVAPVTDERWVERWQASLAPIPLGSRFVVMPNDSARVPDGRERIRLIPGMAFGTGEHETTRLAAAGVERYVARGSRWLDLGTGTGVLAIVAARCGAASVVAVDLDPDVASVASAVVFRNGAADLVEVRTGSIGDLRGATFNGIVANIQASFFLAESASVAAALVSGGVLLASGFLEDDVAELSGVFSQAGLHVEERWFEGPWACLLARRGAA